MLYDGGVLEILGNGTRTLLQLPAGDYYDIADGRTTVVGTPVVGLYACTNPARSGPYLSRQWCVDAFPQATAKFRGSAPERLPWATKIEEPGVMALISVEDTCNRLDALLASRL